MPTAQDSSTFVSAGFPPRPSNVEAHCATLEDWLGIKSVVELLNAHPKFSKFLSCTVQDAQGWLVNSIAFPHSVGMLVVTYEAVVCGVAAVLAMETPLPGSAGVGKGPKHGFMHSVFIAPCVYPWGVKDIGKLRIPSSAGLAMCEMIVKWTRERSCTYVYGNVRPDGHFDGLLRKYGFKVQHKVVGMELGGQ
jgi:hypothetical protein